MTAGSVVAAAVMVMARKKRIAEMFFMVYC